MHRLRVEDFRELMAGSVLRNRSGSRAFGYVRLDAGSSSTTDIVLLTASGMAQLRGMYCGSRIRGVGRQAFLSFCYYGHRNDTVWELRPPGYKVMQEVKGATTVRCFIFEIILLMSCQFGQLKNPFFHDPLANNKLKLVRTCALQRKLRN